MTAPRKTRLAESLRAELAEIIRTEMRDPRFSQGLLTITKVNVTADLKYATVFISVLGEPGAKEGMLKALRGASGLLRAELGRTKAFKSVPELTFRYDESIERGAELFDLIQKANREDAEMHTEHAEYVAEPES